MTLIVLSKLLILITLVKMSSQYPNGAPISVCQTMIPGHQGTFPQPNPAPYIFKISSSSYKNGKPIRVQILGPGYRGLLLESRTYDKTMLIGKWVFPPNDTKILQCPENSAGAITHSNTNLKTQSTTYTWMPPEEDCPPIIFFIATVAESHDVYWLGVKSAAIWKDPEATCGTSHITWGGVHCIIAFFQLAIFLAFQ